VSTGETATPSPKKAFGVVFLTVLLDLIGFGMILPLLPFYAQDFQAGAFEIGLLFSSFSLAQLVFAPLLGQLSDRVGRRPVLLASIAGSVGAYLLFAAAPSYAVLLAARTLSGIAAANYAIAQSYMADVSAPEDRARAMGLIGAAFGVGFVFGPALGGVMMKVGELPSLLHLGHRLVPLAACFLSAVNFVLASLWLKESLPAGLRGRVHGTWNPLRELRAAWANAPLRSLMLLFFLVIFCFSMMEATLALFCQERFGFGAMQTTGLFVYVGVVLAGVQGGLIGKLVRAYGERGVILAGLVLIAAGLALLPAAPAGFALSWKILVPLLASLALLAFGQGLNQPATMGLLSRLTRDTAQGSTIGLTRSFGALARTLGPAAGTSLFAAWGPASPFWAGSALMLLAVVLAVVRVPTPEP
jgi:multidrug resistance protein